MFEPPHRSPVRVQSESDRTKVMSGAHRDLRALPLELSASSLDENTSAETWLDEVTGNAWMPFAAKAANGIAAVFSTAIRSKRRSAKRAPREPGNLGSITPRAQLQGDQPLRDSGEAGEREQRPSPVDVVEIIDRAEQGANAATGRFERANEVVRGDETSFATDGVDPFAAL